MHKNEATSVLGDLWESFQRMDFYWARFVVGGLFIAILITVEFWKFMLPFWGLCGLVIFYLRVTRERGSL